MPRIKPIELDQAEGKTKVLLENVQKALGIVPNLMRTIANSPAALEAYLGFGKAVGGGNLSAALREQIALTVAGENSCEYCASAHTALGERFGLAKGELAANLEASSEDHRTQAALQFAQAVVAKRGWVSDDELRAVRDAGYGDADIAEIVAVVSINIFANYFSHVAKTEIDFPVVTDGDPAASTGCTVGGDEASCASKSR